MENEYGMSGLDYMLLNTNAQVEVKVTPPGGLPITFNMLAIGEGLSYRSTMLVPKDIPKDSMLEIQLLMKEELGN